MVLEWLRQGFQNVVSGIQTTISSIFKREEPQPEIISRQETYALPPPKITLKTDSTSEMPIPIHIQEAVQKAKEEGKQVEVVTIRPEVKIPSPWTDPLQGATREELEKYVKEKPDPEKLRQEVELFNKDVKEYEKDLEKLGATVVELKTLEREVQLAEEKAKITGDYSEYEKAYSKYEKYYHETYLPLYKQLEAKYKDLEGTQLELKKKEEAYKKGELAEFKLALEKEPEPPSYYSPIARQAGRPIPIPGMLGDILDVVGGALGLYQPKKEEIERVAKYEKEFAEVNPIYARLLETQKFFEEKFVKEPMERFERESAVGKAVIAPAVLGGFLVGGLGIWGTEAGKMITATPTGLGKSLREILEGRPEEAQKTIQKTTEISVRSTAEFTSDLFVGWGIGKALSKGFTAVAPYVALPFEKGYKAVRPVVEPVAERVKPAVSKISTAVKEATELKPRELEIKMTRPEDIVGRYSFEEGLEKIKSAIGTVEAETVEQIPIREVRIGYTPIEKEEIISAGIVGKKVKLEEISEQAIGKTIIDELGETGMTLEPFLFSRAKIEGVKGIRTREALVKWYETTGLVAKEPKEVDLTAKVISYRKITPFLKKETTLGITMKPGLGRVLGLEGRRGAMIELRTPELWHSTGFLVPASKKGWLVFEKRIVDDIVKFKKAEIGKKPSKPLKFEELSEDISKPISKPEQITKAVEKEVEFKPRARAMELRGLPEPHPSSMQYNRLLYGRTRPKLVFEEEYVRYTYPDVSKVIPELVPRVRASKIGLRVGGIQRTGIKPRITARVRTDLHERVDDILRLDRIATPKEISDLTKIKPPIEKPKPLVFEIPTVSEMPAVGELTRIELPPIPQIPDIVTPHPPTPKTALVRPWKIRAPSKVVVPPLPIPGFGVGEKKARGRWKKQWYRREWELFRKLFS